MLAPICQKNCTSCLSEELINNNNVRLIKSQERVAECTSCRAEQSDAEKHSAMYHSRGYLNPYNSYAMKFAHAVRKKSVCSVMEKQLDIINHYRTMLSKKDLNISVECASSKRLRQTKAVKCKLRHASRNVFKFKEHLKSPYRQNKRDISEFPLLIKN